MLSGEFQYIPMGAETWLHVSGGKEMTKAGSLKPLWAELNTIFETFVNHIQQSLSRQALYMETTGEASTSCTCKD